MDECNPKGGDWTFHAAYVYADGLFHNMSAGKHQFDMSPKEAVLEDMSYWDG